MEAQKAKLKQLILDAETLMQTAKSEARQIVASAEAQARELVDAAWQLHTAAETESSQLRSSAAEIRRQAEEDARRLSDEAQARHLAAIEEARSVVSSPGRQAQPLPPDMVETTDEDVLREASRRADQMLRVARSEAKARSDELLEQARRRAAQIDEDARRREEVAAKQFREIQRRMRDEQLEIKTRIAELRAELRAVESTIDSPSGEWSDGQKEIHIDVEPVDEGHEGTVTRNPSDVAATPPAAKHGEVKHGEAPPPAVPERRQKPQDTNVTSRLEPRPQGSDDGEASDEYTRAMRRFRRRA
jgi:vacuolar-type H+-ATPase subunit H